MYLLDTMDEMAFPKALSPCTSNQTRISFVSQTSLELFPKRIFQRVEKENE